MSEDGHPPNRTVTLVLVDAEGQVLGELPPFEAGSPWFMEAQPVIDAAREHYAAEVALLRLLEGTHGSADGRVTYLAEVAGPTAELPLQPWAGKLDDHPLRLPWARPGGPARDIEWARHALDRHALALAGEPQQVRTWNLSSLWRLPVARETIWLKAVPPFFAHEGRLIELLEGRPVPRLLAREGHRMLLREIPGQDMYEPTLEQRLLMIDQLVEIQADFIERTGELLALGLPDWRSEALTHAIADVVTRVGRQLGDPLRRSLSRLVAGLAERWSQVHACGLPDTLVHGDFHPANHRGSGRSLTLLDWGDSGVGHPLLDQPAFLDRAPKAELPAITAHWSRRWQELVPGSDAARAAQLLEPIAALRQAVVYQRFLDNIEPSERSYHAADPLVWLARAASLVEGDATGGGGP